MAKKKNKTVEGPKVDQASEQEIDTAMEALENKRRELFCRHYAQGEGTFGNATLSYAAAYEYDLIFVKKTDRWGTLYDSPVDLNVYQTCGSNGSRLLKDDKVQARITVLLNELLKDEIVDAELAKVVKQDGELQPKVQAIKEYNKLRGRIIDHSKVTHVQKLDMDDIRALISVLPQERQDQFYATISDILAEAELRRSGGQGESRPAERSEDNQA